MYTHTDSCKAAQQGDPLGSRGDPARAGVCGASMQCLSDCGLVYKARKGARLRTGPRLRGAAGVCSKVYWPLFA